MAKDKEKAELVVKKESDVLSPFGEMERYFEEMFRQPFALFGHPLMSRTQFPGKEVVSPTVDIFEEGKEVVIKAEIPGMKKVISISISVKTA